MTKEDLLKLMLDAYSEKIRALEWLGRNPAADAAEFLDEFRGIQKRLSDEDFAWVRKRFMEETGLSDHEKN